MLKPICIDASTVAYFCREARMCSFRNAPHTSETHATHTRTGNMKGKVARTRTGHTAARTRMCTGGTAACTRARTGRTASRTCTRTRAPLSTWLCKESKLQHEVAGELYKINKQSTFLLQSPNFWTQQHLICAQCRCLEDADPGVVAEKAWKHGCSLEKCPV
eukprot:scaffold147583_cov20-Tisochrysis_lutea.AAC.1